MRKSRWVGIEEIGRKKGEEIRTEVLGSWGNGYGLGWRVRRNQGVGGRRNREEEIEAGVLGKKGGRNHAARGGRRNREEMGKK
ncbi:hypothetical protein Pyn_25242 [Prunus yedoensis var. nudiflora]|uniref:Uncharacterized protein n=1 Tax=Prunus yedoensis var. nudiflora TaxID=2094558 RepID=A0A314YBS4_PRUYE|nr:hypothetical protein Pyn_25242 [Prunus yedoensis var. nudiflora]